MTWISKLIGGNCKNLEIENQQLKELLEISKKKLVEKQAVINQTNAYWKKKVRDLKQSFSKKKDL